MCHRRRTDAHFDGTSKADSAAREKTGRPPVRGYRARSGHRRRHAALRAGAVSVVRLRRRHRHARQLGDDQRQRGGGGHLPQRCGSAAGTVPFRRRDPLQRPADCHPRRRLGDGFYHRRRSAGALHDSALPRVRADALYRFCADARAGLGRRRRTEEHVLHRARSAFLSLGLRRRFGGRADASSPQGEHVSDADPLKGEAPGCGL